MPDTTISAYPYRWYVIRCVAYCSQILIQVKLLSIALTITMREQGNASRQPFDIRHELTCTVKYGMGRHFDTLTKDDTLHLLQWFWASVWIYYSSLCFTKVSILLQYLRVFPQNSFRKACFVMMGIIIAYSVATFLTSVFACIPVDSIWNPTIKRTCVNLKALWYSQPLSKTKGRLPLMLIPRFTNAGINIVTDIGTGVLPLPVLHSLDLPRRRKYALMAVFALGGLYVVQARPS